MQHLVGQLQKLAQRLRMGGGPQRIERQHKAGKLTARERLEKLLDPDSYFLEIGLLVAYDRYDGHAPAAGVVTGIGLIAGRPAVVVANDATVKAGAWWPETITKILRSQEIAMRHHVPIVYLVDSAGVNLPYQDGIFPGQYGAGRIFYYNAKMRRELRVPQIAAVMGPCIAGGAYLPALSDVIIMVDKTSFMGLGGPNLVKGATGQTVDAETLGGAAMHNEISGVAHYRAANDKECLATIRRLISDLPGKPAPARDPSPPLLNEEEVYETLPSDHRLPYDIQEVIFRVFDRQGYLEFMPEYAPEILCANARLEGIPVGVIANRRGFFSSEGQPRVGGILYTESARKVSYFVENCSRHSVPLVYLQDVSGFMVGTQAERSGIIRAGAEMVETMSCARGPKIIVTLNHASGAGYYAMAGQGFDPNFSFSWPTARVGVMEGESAVQALFAAELEKLRATGQVVPEDLQEAIERTRADYERWLDARFAAARGYVDAVIDPRDTRRVLRLALEVAAAA
ncbi:MAG: acyl-CoA carboxylase subunit beta [Acidobacteria bacterium]|nr:acyl-CoA carboxylase subunit beta [Acidobacteriota bacterium]